MKCDQIYIFLNDRYDWFGGPGSHLVICGSDIKKEQHSKA